MFRLRLETIQLRSPVTAIHLAVTAADRLPHEQQTLFAVESHQTEPRLLAQAIDRLTHRLGREAVLRPLLLADAQPEHACQYLPLSQARGTGKSSADSSPGVSPPIGKQRRVGQAKNRTSQNPSATDPAGPAGRQREPPVVAVSPIRPTRLYLPPIALHDVAMAADGTAARFSLSGERAASRPGLGTRADRDRLVAHALVRRDYYRVETTAAERYWLFRCLTENRWFLQGAFD